MYIHLFSALSQNSKEIMIWGPQCVFVYRKIYEYKSLPVLYTIPKQRNIRHILITHYHIQYLRKSFAKCIYEQCGFACAHMAFC